MLSGYLITGVLAQEQAAHGRFRVPAFYARRFLRLAPALWLLLAADLLWYALDPTARRGTLGAIVASAAYFMNYSRIFGWMGEGVLGHCWSLAIEEQFYLLWPMVLLLVPRRRWLPAAGALFVLAAAWRTWLASHGASFAWVYNSFDCRVDLLLLGCTLSLSSAWLRTSAAAWIRHGWPVAAVGLLLMLIGPAENEALTMSLAISGVGLCTSVLILAIEALVLRGPLVARPVVALGRVSYGVHLWHYPLLGLLRFYGFHGAQLLATIPLTLIIAALSFHWVERPLLRVKERLVAVNGRFGTA